MIRVLIVLCLMERRDVQGPTWGYPTEGAYYRDSSSADSVLAVRIPLFAIHAEDDPVILLVCSISINQADHVCSDRCNGSRPRRRD